MIVRMQPRGGGSGQVTVIIFMYTEEGGQKRPKTACILNQWPLKPMSFKDRQLCVCITECFFHLAGPSFGSSLAPTGAGSAPPPALMSTPAPPPSTTGTPSQPPPTTSQPTAMTPLVPSGPGTPSAPQNQQHPAPLSAPPGKNTGVDFSLFSTINGVPGKSCS